MGKHTEARTNMLCFQNRIPVDLAYGAKVGRRVGEMGRSSGMAKGLRLWLRLHGKVQVRKPLAAPTQTERAKPSAIALRKGGAVVGTSVRRGPAILAQMLLDSLG